MTRLLFICNVDWFFISHRLPIAIEAKKNNYEIHIACKNTKFKNQFLSLGFNFHDLNIKRGRFSFIHDFYILILILKIILTVKPKIIHLITIKPIILGGIIVSFFNKIFCVFSFAGLGHTFVQTSFLNKLRLKLIKIIYKLILKKSRKKIIFQNSFDLKVISKLTNLLPNDYKIIKGSGIDLNNFKFKKIPNGPIVFLMASRLIWEKGIKEFVEASKIIEKKFKNTVFILAGSLDQENPSSLTNNDLKKIQISSNVKYIGFVKDIKKLIEKSHVIVLPSYYGEGVPKFLIEGCAIGRPIITSSIPGCKYLVSNGKNGYFVKPKNIASLVEAMEKILNQRKKLNLMGTKSRKIAEKNFDLSLVIKKHLEIYSVMRKN